MSKVYILYHEDCLDGYGAAWAAFQLFKDEATYLPVAAGSTFPDLDLEAATVYCLDVAFRPEQLENALGEGAKKIVVIDHHKTAAEWYADYDAVPGIEIHMDMSHSGAVLAWRYFQRERAVPEILLYIEDRDLWNWNLPDSECILLALDAYPYTMGNLSRLQNDMERLKLEGSAILKYRNQMIDLQMKAAHLMHFDLGVHADGAEEIITVPAINCSLRAVTSEACHELLQRNPDAPFVVAYRRGADGAWNFSLRGRGDYKVDEFAARFNGGGHADAAGMTLDTLPPVSEL